MDEPKVRRVETPGDRLVRTLRVTLAPVASLKITVVLFAFSLLLVFFGTLAQKGESVWTVVEDYFFSWVVKVDLKYSFEFAKVFFRMPANMTSNLWFPLPGGQLLGWAMLINLSFAHILQFVNLVDGVRKGINKRSPIAEVAILMLKRSGIYILHAGVLLLLVGEYVTRKFQIEQQMVIAQGQSTNYAFETRNFEVAIIDRSDPTSDTVTVVPWAKFLEAKARRDSGGRAGWMFWKAKVDTPAIVSHPDLPYDFELLEYYPNSKLQNAPANGNLSDIGLGKEALAVSAPVVNGLDQTQKVDLPSAYVRVLDKADGHAIGTYLFSSQIDDPQSVPSTKFALAFRMTRHYKPFELKLNQFHFDRYPGTETAKNYSSELRLIDSEKNIDREVVVKMNNPLRHRGEAFFQSSFTPDEKATILQVVQNPGWMLPYISCLFVMVGMTLHFSIKLVTFLNRALRGSLAGRPAAAKNNAALAAGPVDLTGRSRPRWLKFATPIAWTALATIVLGGLTWPQKPKSDKLDLSAVATLPVLEGGRIKPLDSLARVDLRVISHQEETRGPSDVKISAIRWYFDTATSDPKNRDEKGASELNIFRIENEEVRVLLKLKAREGLKYSLKDFREQFDAFDAESKKAGEVPDNERDLYQKKLLELRRHVEMYLGVVYGGAARTIAPETPGAEWQLAREAETALNDQARPKFMKALREAGIPLNPDQMTEEQQKQAVGIIQAVQRESASANPALNGWKNVLSAYRTNDPKEFDKAVAEYRELLKDRVDAKDLKRCEFETALNQSNLSYWCMVMYAIAGVLSLLGFVALAIYPSFGIGMRRGVFWWLLVTFLAHTFALVARMYLMDRWGVFTTNLYSSAVFIGWVVVLLCLIAELIFPIGFGNLVASVLGFMTAIIAHNLAVGGDTLEMMQAVLDDNFWLSTHVTTVTAGYSATYVAGLLGIIYAALNMVPEKWVLRKSVKIGIGQYAIQSDVGKILGTLLYAVLAFATLLSFVGTVLGGIWADQSWGRFWGWDPKENGAVLIVIWNALILHARWGGLVKERGMAVLAIFGGVITTWSWFGTNQLGVGLHAYGFSKTLVDTCKALWLICGFALLAGVLPWQWIYKPPTTSLPVGKRV